MGTTTKKERRTAKRERKERHWIASVIDGATNKYIDDDESDASGAARRLSPRLEAREEIAVTIASFEFCTIIYLFMKRIYSIYL